MILFWLEIAISGGAGALAIHAVPRHFRHQDGEAAPAGGSGHREASAEESAEVDPVRMDREGEDGSDEDSEADGELDLLHEREAGFAVFLHGQIFVFPCEDAAFEIPDIGQADGLQFRLGLRAAFAAAAHDDDGGGGPVDLGVAVAQLSERDEFGSGDVFLGVLDRFADIDEFAAGRKKVIEFVGLDGFRICAHGGVILT